MNKKLLTMVFILNMTIVSRYLNAEVTDDDFKNINFFCQIESNKNDPICKNIIYQSPKQSKDKNNKKKMCHYRRDNLINFLADFIKCAFN